MEIEEILTSKGRIKILKLLTMERELNISEIMKQTGLSYASVNRHLEELKRGNIIIEKKFGRIRIFRINDKSVIVKALEEFLMKV
ncbi:MAG: winged helix-turn-helix domain-containing protein [Candidatus Methanomethylicia archaeon]|nr:winged helix-turn-helix domain-containing protein [Candidatus Methanomethylicia archaeon]MCX8168977.1 winged helix-turn-helix domain-containing protein [Candidatus Methanomethylicia archaeon]MDW7988709.1 winged helix-turn-helix domain-containing protein [Nitrososphaerota archaeon]